MNNFEEQFPAGFHKKGLAGFFYVQEARAHGGNFGRSRSTERGEISYINGDTGGDSEEKLSFRSSLLRNFTTPR